MLMTTAEKDCREDKHIDEKHEIEQQIMQREEEVCDLFYVFDRDRSGTISLEELSRVMVKFGGLTKEEIDVMLLDADIDGDGMVIIYNVHCSKNFIASNLYMYKF